MMRRFPYEGTFELTARCNLRCRMCFVRIDEETVGRSGKQERTAGEWIRLAEQAAEAGTFKLLLTGGEVCIRPDFPEIYESIARMGFIISVYTNATLISDRIMDVFGRFPPHTIGVTMYGAGNDTYNKLCGNASGFDHFREGLRRLKELPSLLEMRTTIVRTNKDDYAAMKAFTEEEFGPGKVLRVTSHVFPRTRGAAADPRLERLASQEMFHFLNGDLLRVLEGFRNGCLDPELFLRHEDLEELLRELHRRRPQPEGSYLFGGCGAGLKSFFVSWDGGMYACGALPKGCTHPFEDGFKTAWASLPEQYPPSRRNSKCASCEYLPFCDSCPASRILETGDFCGIPEYACENARLMKELLEGLCHP